MNCPKCGARARAIDSRIDGAKVYRKRECDNCHHKIFTVEVETEDNGFRFYELNAQYKLKQYYERKNRKEQTR